MPKSLKYSLYLLLFGVLTIYSVFVKDLFKKSYTPGEIQGAATHLELFILPEAGKSPILDKINLANSEILVEVYMLSDKDIINAVKDANNRGVATKILLEKNPYGGGSLNKNSFTDLQLFNVPVKWANPTFALTHEKAIILDNKVVCILNQNLTTSAFTKNREYNVCTEEPTDVTEARNIFFADWNRSNFNPTTTNLVISPNTARGKIEALINSSQRSLDIEIEIIDDEAIENILKQKSQSVPIRLIIPTIKKIPSNEKMAKSLKSNGIEVKQLNSPYPHAKLIIADELKAYTGSVNFSTASFDDNRELGIIISQKNILDQLQNQFNEDWKFSEPLP